MNTDRLFDGRRKMPDKVINYIRTMAVSAVMEMNLSHELIAKSYHVNRSCIYHWIKQYDDGIDEALRIRMAPGADTLITAEMDEWLKQSILECTPVKIRYDKYVRNIQNFIQVDREIIGWNG